MTQHIYVDTDATAGGDGTTRAHTGAAAAFASAAAAMAAVPNPLTEDVYVHFAGTTEDGTIDSFSVPGNATHQLYLCADEGADHSADGGDDGALYDGDGFNDDVGGAWSTSHYRAFSSGSFFTARIGSYTTLDRLQLRNTKSSGNAECVRPQGSNMEVKRCRLTKDGISGRAIFLNGSSVSIHTLRVYNNLIFACGSEGLDIDSRSNAGFACRIQHNTIVNCHTGILLNQQGNNPNYEVYNNVVVGATTDYSNFDGLGMTVTATHNAGEGATAPAGHTSHWIGGITSADFEQLASVSGGYDDIDWRPAAGSLLLDAGDYQGIDEGFNETPRDTSTPDVGAFEIDSGGGATTGTSTLTIPALEQSGSGLAETVGSGAQTLHMLRQSSTATLTVPGTAAQVVPALEQAGEGDHTASTEGTAAQTLPPLEQAADGTLTITGSSEQVIPALEQAADATLTLSGTGAQVTPALEQAASASSVEGHEGTAAQTLPAMQQAGDGTQTVTVAGEGAQTIAALTQAGAAEQIIAGTAAQVMAAMQQAGAGLETIAATGVQVLAALTQGAVATLEPDATGAQVLPALEQQGEADLPTFGTGTQTVPALRQAGLGLSAGLPGLGTVIDPILISRTPQRTLNSRTLVRTVHER